MIWYNHRYLMILANDAKYIHLLPIFCRYFPELFILKVPSWHSDVVTTLSQRCCWRCHDVVAWSKMRVVPTSVSNVVTTLLSNVVKTLPQRCYNVATTLGLFCGLFYYGLFWFLSLHRNVKFTKVLSGIKHTLFLFKKTLYL